MYVWVKVALVALCIYISAYVYIHFRYKSYLVPDADHSWLLKHSRDLEEPQNHTTEIPKVIHQTYFKREKVPLKVEENISRFAPEYKRIFYDDNDIKRFLGEHFHPDVKSKFESLDRGAHKADLFRYCILYVQGGIYMDIKTELIQPITTYFPENSISTVISRTPKEIYQGIIAAPPRQQLFLALISAIVKSGNKPPYNLFIRDFMKYVKLDTKEVKEGALQGNKHNYFLYREVCTKNPKECSDGLDRYGACCNIFLNGQKMIKSRYSDYPWN
jgi:hypothetical protein